MVIAVIGLIATSINCMSS